MDCGPPVEEPVSEDEAWSSGYEAPSEPGDDGGSDPDRDERDVARRVEELVAASRTHLTGYMSCTLEPFVAVPMLCRITCRPVRAPPGRQTILCTCYRHPGYRLYKAHRRWSERTMIRWFWPGVVRGAADREAHAAMTAEIGP